MKRINFVDFISDTLCQREGFFRDPKDCVAFYRCVADGVSDSFRIYRFACPPGTVFDERISVCNWPQSSPPCDSRPNQHNNELQPASRDQRIDAYAGPQYSHQGQPPYQPETRPAEQPSYQPAEQPDYQPAEQPESLPDYFEEQPLEPPQPQPTRRPTRSRTTVKPTFRPRGPQRTTSQPMSASSERFPYVRPRDPPRYQSPATDAPAEDEWAGDEQDGQEQPQEMQKNSQPKVGK